MWVRILAPVRGPERDHEVGDQVELDDDAARLLIGQGAAEQIQKPAKRDVTRKRSK